MSTRVGTSEEHDDGDEEATMEGSKKKRGILRVESTKAEAKKNKVEKKVTIQEEDGEEGCGDVERVPSMPRMSSFDVFQPGQLEMLLEKCRSGSFKNLTLNDDSLFRSLSFNDDSFFEDEGNSTTTTTTTTTAATRTTTA
ncbi:hypothetical protein HOP50_07g47250 [Chloropicon primus]|uniref:Uncharacterized protein n=1 Tax=Chloropicon primus TaxID=1764295 RepID=A0A5B8MNU0_9CHLO|nr:hypothetical protein A3770_07p47040 [Chloropicon primus]UPR01403.1 hypothetical protein HOP50_07g47250 [Chloropicon primus]|mmetsp:Transcript_1500/g.4331  ORF Transcript_1500/g.4331 Transcript_1500/m.4331 type:complete len:140 (-) Transcript_1500:2364-2783(-)|eukprot:QDZ22186.1 hypothetical protein A3770_07p47040 [Chloropicon primus]